MVRGTQLLSEASSRRFRVEPESIFCNLRTVKTWGHNTNWFLGLLFFLKSLASTDKSSYFLIAGCSSPFVFPLLLMVSFDDVWNSILKLDIWGVTKKYLEELNQSLWRNIYLISSRWRKKLYRIQFFKTKIQMFWWVRTWERHVNHPVGS